MTVVIVTARLVLRHASLDDAPFMLELLNDPDFVRCIGDRGVRTLEQAGTYISERLIASYESNGFGLYLATRKSDAAPIGICGLVKRVGLDDVDVGYALMPAYRGSGYAVEGAAATLAFARETLGLPRVVAIVRPDNVASIRLLESLGMTLEDTMRLEPGGPEISRYAITFTQVADPFGRS